MVDQESQPFSQHWADDDPIDRALVARIRAAGIGDRGAWGDLLKRYQDRLFAVCLRMVGDRDRAADLTQDAFVKILQGLESWDGRSRLSTWMIRVTMNVCLSHLRAAKLRRTTSLDAPVTATQTRGERLGDVRRPDGGYGGSRGAAAGEPGAGEGVEQREQKRRLLAALAGLDPEQRSIIVLRDVQGLDYEQIAAALGTAVGTVKSRLFRARLALRELMEKQGVTDR